MPTEENKNLQNGSTNGIGDSGNASNISGDDKKKDSLDLDIDLNLDGIDIDDKNGKNQEVENLKNQELNLELNEGAKKEIKEEDKNTNFENKNNEEPRLNVLKRDSKELNKLSGDGYEEGKEDNLDTNDFDGGLEKLEPINEEPLDNTDNKKLDNSDQELSINSIGNSTKIDNQKEESLNKNNDDDWLAEEDKKVEEQKKTSSNFDNGKKENKEDNGEKDKNIVKKNDNDMNLENLDIPFVKKNVDTEELNFKSTDKNIDNKEKGQELDLKERNEKSNIEEKQDFLDLGSLDIPETNNSIEKKEEVGLHTENLGEEVLENKDGDIVSDTGDLNSKGNGYIPNEHDFSQTVGALNSTEKGQIDLDSLQKDQKKSDNSQLETNDSIKKQEGSLDLDGMISNFENNNSGQVESKVLSGQNVDIEINKPLEDSNQTQNQGLDNVKNKENPINNNIDLGYTEVQKNNIDSTKPQIEQNSDPIQQSVNQVKNQNMTSPKAVVLNEEPKINNKHSGLKIFILIILLLIGGIMVLSRMYPEEFGDIMGAIKGEDTTVIDYGDDDKIDISLNEDQDISFNTGNMKEDLNEDVENNISIDEKDKEELDPNSLAGQIEKDNQSGVNNVVEYGSGVEKIDLDSGHDFGEADFNVFEGLEEVIDPNTSKNAELLKELNDYKVQGDDYNEWGRSQGNSTAMKYGLYISRNAEELINDIENNIKIDMNETDKYFAQFDIYLEKLSGLRESIEGVVGNNNLDSSIENNDTTEQSSGTIQEV